MRSRWRIQSLKYIPLTSRRRSPRKYNRLAFAKSFLDQVEHEFVVQHRIGVVHSHGIWTIVIGNRRVRDTFPEIGLGFTFRVGFCFEWQTEITLKQSTPRSISAESLSIYHLRAAGFVISTIARPGCQLESFRLCKVSCTIWRTDPIYIPNQWKRVKIERFTYCQGVPSFLLIKYPPLTPSENMGENWEMYGFTVRSSQRVI